MKLNQNLIIGVAVGFLLSKFLTKTGIDAGLPPRKDDGVAGPYSNLLAGYRYGNPCQNCSNPAPIRYGYTNYPETAQYAKMTA